MNAQINKWGINISMNIQNNKEERKGNNPRSRRSGTQHLKIEQKLLKFKF